jgi:8-amino-7-oxononanoate synthase
VLDLTSSLYLGIVHPSRDLPSWDSLTAGKPAALAELPAAGQITQRIGRLINMPSVRLWTSTLHAFVDLSAVLSAKYPEASIAIDSQAYPIGCLGLASAPGRSGRNFRRLLHYDVPAARRWAAGERAQHRAPVLLVDGWCPGCGRVAPLSGLAAAVSKHGGLLVVDDTQAIGLLGAGPDARHPWGLGGGGSFVHRGSPAGTVIVASLAKAFGVPLAVVAGSTELVASTWHHGPTILHSSPPAVPVGLAATRALAINDRMGDQLRQRLLSLVDRLHRCLAGFGIAIDSKRFPVARVPLPSTAAAAGVVRALETAGIRTVALAPSCLGRPAVGLALHAGLRPADIERISEALSVALRRAA